jgi:hypothetical protein
MYRTSTTVQPTQYKTGLDLTHSEIDNDVHSHCVLAGDRIRFVYVP